MNDLTTLFVGIVLTLLGTSWLIVERPTARDLRFLFIIAVLLSLLSASVVDGAAGRKFGAVLITIGGTFVTYAGELIRDRHGLYEVLLVGRLARKIRDRGRTVR